MIIPTDGREVMALYREGVTLEAYLDAIWFRREAENPPAKRLKRRKWKWPLNLREGNVTPLRRGKS